MKRVILILLGTALAISCQKADDNGDLGGWWKLMQIEEIENDTIIDKSNEDRFWAIQLEMITTNNGGKGRFQHIGDSLFVQMIQKPANGKDVGMYSPENERFCVEKLTNKSMMLQSEKVRLKFRKF